MGGRVMNCPICGSKTKVIDSRSDCESVARKRKCLDCKQIFYTAEYECQKADFSEIERMIGTERRNRKRGVNE